MRMDGRTDMTRLIAASRNFANALKSDLQPAKVSVRLFHIHFDSGITLLKRYGSGKQNIMANSRFGEQSET